MRFPPVFILAIWIGGLAAAQAAELKTATLAEIGKPSRHELAASVQSPNDSVLASEVSARIADIYVDVGQVVDKGDLLIGLDARDAQLHVQQAVAQLESAKAQRLLADQRLQRGHELDTRKFISADELLALQTQLQATTAERDIRAAALASARRQLDKCKVTAPFSGVVMERMAQQGALAMPGTPLLRLVDSAPPEVDAALPFELASRWSMNTAALDAARFEYQFGSLWLPLRLLRLSPAIEASSRTQRARLAFVDQAAPAGSSGQLRIVSSGSQLAPVYFVQRDGMLGAFLVEQQRAVFKPIAGALPGRSAEVDWPEDTVLVIEGHLSLQHGDPITLKAD